MKKAQTIGQALMFVLAGLVFVLILIYGYKAISNLTERGEQVEMLNFKTDLQSAVETIKRDYGSVQKIELRPPKADKVCFVTSDLTASVPGFAEKYPLLYNSWQTGTENVFIIPIPEQATPIFVKDLEIKGQGWLCTDASKRKIVLRIEGTGKTAKVSEW